MPFSCLLFLCDRSLVAEIYRTVWDYNNTRIHSALNMPPVVFAKLYAFVA